MTVPTVLITGFGPFPGAPFNPSGPLAQALARRRRPALAEARRIAHVFPTSYAAVDRELPELLARHRPDIVLMLGLAARTPFVRIESRARNARSVLFADAEGRLPAARAIVPGGPSSLRPDLPGARLLVAARPARVDTRLSRDAGRYLCNYAYWRALEAAAAEPARPRVQFVHIPRLRRPGEPGLRPTLADLVRLGEAVLVALVKARR